MQKNFHRFQLNFSIMNLTMTESSLAVANAVEIASSSGMNSRVKLRALQVLEEKFCGGDATHGDWREEFERETGKKE